jgi:HPt (histidine-containing phosphotransfer) domain-containing protein
MPAVTSPIPSPVPAAAPAQSPDQSSIAARASWAPQAPIDLVFLARQTFGDRAVEQEVLGLFREQAPRLAAAARTAARGADGTERARVAHRLAGAARAIGAGAVASAAAEVERHAAEAALADLDAAVAAALAFIAILDHPPKLAG